MSDLTQEEKTAAEKIVLSWNWQISEGHNYKFKHGLHALTRFYESAPMEADQFRLVLKYLSKQEDIEIININHKGVSLDGTWKAKDAWYQTVQGDKFEGSDANRVRIYQTIVGKDEDSADGPYLVENGCKYKISHMFFWDVASIPNLESGEYVSSSGIQYSMQGVSRDRETGLFSCVIEKRETVQQDIPLYESSMTIFEKVEKEGHLGVKQANVASTGLAASVEDGVLVERELSKNADCTTDVANRKTTEKQVEDAVKGYRKTLRGTIETTTDRNQSDPLDDEEMKVGESRQSEKTPGGLYNNTKSLVTTEAAGKIVDSCEKASKEHTDTTVENMLNKPDIIEQLSDENVVKTLTARQNEEGTWDVTKVTKTYSPRTASITWTSGGGTYKHTTFNHQKQIPNVKTPSGGSASASVSQNIVGTYDGSIQTFSPDLDETGAVSGIILKESGNVNIVEVDRQPGGVERRRVVTMSYEQGTAAGSTALLRAKDGYAYGNYSSHASCSADGKVGQWIKYGEPIFGAWSTVS